MTDRIYPSKPASNPPQKLNGNANPPFPATKAQSFNRPMYRPQPKPSRRRRSCCCICCLWTTLLIGILILLAAIAGVVIWILYRPQHPTFSVTAVRISQFNVTTNKDGTSQLNSNLDLTVSTRNPNKKLVFFYDPTTVTMSSAGIDGGRKRDGERKRERVRERERTNLLWSAEEDEDVLKHGTLLSNNKDEQVESRVLAPDLAPAP